MSGLLRGGSELILISYVGSCKNYITDMLEQDLIDT